MIAALQQDLVAAQLNGFLDLLVKHLTGEDIRIRVVRVRIQSLDQEHRCRLQVPRVAIVGVEQSLRRMKTDYLDLVQFHHSPSRAQLAEGGLDALQDLQRQGKIRHIGMSGTLPNLPDQIDLGVFDVFQVPYSALQREHEALVHQASQVGAGIVIRGGVARGDPARERGGFWDKWQEAEIDDLLGEMSRMEFLLRFTRKHPERFSISELLIPCLVGLRIIRSSRYGEPKRYSFSQAPVCSVSEGEDS